MERGDLDELLAAITKMAHPPASGQSAEDRLGRMISDAMDRGKEKLDVQTSLRFDRSINAGQVVQIVGLILTLGGGIWWGSERITKQEAAIAEIKRDMDANVARTVAAVPKIDALDYENKVQNERIQNVAQQMAEMRKGNTEILSTLGTIRENIATIVATQRQQTR
jgi:hypothetical protein